jgi:hypothetical protein
MVRLWLLDQYDDAELDRKKGHRPAFRPLGDGARPVQPAADLHPVARALEGQADLMEAFAGATAGMAAAQAAARRAVEAIERRRVCR